MDISISHSVIANTKKFVESFFLCLFEVLGNEIGNELIDEILRLRSYTTIIHKQHNKNIFAIPKTRIKAALSKSFGDQGFGQEFKPQLGGILGSVE